MSPDAETYLAAGDKVSIRAKRLPAGQGLSYPAFSGVLVEDAGTSEGWDVVDVREDQTGEIISVYCFSIERPEVLMRGTKADFHGDSSKPYVVNLCSSDPLADNAPDDWDECAMGEDFATLAEALAVYQSENPLPGLGINNPSFFRTESWLWIHGPDIDQSRQFRPEAKEDRDDDDDWTREQAMQAGMAFGCDGYNDAMGY